MLDDDAGSGAFRIELADAFIRRIGIVDVVVRQFLALELPRSRDARAFLRRLVERSVLMWIFAVAQRLNPFAADRAKIRRVDFQSGRKPVRDC